MRKVNPMLPKAATTIAVTALAIATRSYMLYSEEPYGFADVRAQSGIDFRLVNSPTAERFLVEAMTGGCAFVDFDGDGLLDVFLVNGATIASEPGKPVRIDKSAPRYWNRLYRNLGNGKFLDVTERSGVRGKGYGLGVAVGDFDNDGYPDLYITNYGGNELLHNRRDGTFEDVTARAGVAAGGFSTSAVFLDYDRDGLLDLYVPRYLDWSFEKNKFCGAQNVRDYCSPREFEGTAGLLFRNRGDGVFTDVSHETGVDLKIGKGLGAALGDLDNDGWPDIYVANDQVPSFLLHNLQGKTFEEIGLTSRTALKDDGSTFAGMGVDFADYDNDGWSDILATALSLEGYPLFHNNHDGTFDDVSQAAGLRKASFYLGGWGTHFIDFDNDGWKDIFVANSHVMPGIRKLLPTVAYEQAPMLLRNTEGRFADASAALGAAALIPVVARGAAFGDFDNDGCIDILVQILGGAPLLLRNRCDPTHHWVGLQLTGTTSNRDGIGASVTVTGKLGEKRYFYVSRGSSYLSSSDARLISGLGGDTAARVEIRWPSGVIQQIANPPDGRYSRIVEKR